MESDVPVSGGDALGRLAGARPARRRGLPQEVTDQLLDLIAGSETQEVVLPPERRLGDELEVSRNVLREALAALDHMGVVETRGKTRIARTARARAIVLARASAAAPVRELVLDPIEVRRIIEPESAALAAKRASGPSLREIERTIELMDDGIRRGESVVEYDSAFHIAVARATANEILIELVGALSDSLQRSRELSFRPEGAARAALDDHRAILAAIRAGDSRAARKAMRVHIDHVEQLIRASVS
jgi:GntR family transcriptional regulator, transcriptional repressor for pyruvate dehydrogenase complex